MKRSHEIMAILGGGPTTPTKGLTQSWFITTFKNWDDPPRSKISSRRKHLQGSSPKMAPLFESMIGTLWNKGGDMVILPRRLFIYYIFSGRSLFITGLFFVLWVIFLGGVTVRPTGIIKLTNLVLNQTSIMVERWNLFLFQCIILPSEWWFYPGCLADGTWVQICFLSFPGFGTWMSNLGSKVRFVGGL